MPAAAIAGIAAAGAIGGAAISSSAAKSAASTQSDAAMSAAELQYKASQEALAFEKEQWATTQANQAPFLKAGTSAVNTLADLTSTPGEGLLTPWTEEFNAPNAVTEQNDPGYKFRLQQGMDVMERSAAAKGNLLTGGTAKGLEDYAQNYASNEYSNVYSRAMQEYQQRYNIFENNQTNEYNRLAGLAGTGQTAANTLATTGTNTANSISNLLSNTASSVGNAYQNAAAATASGYVGSGNAWSGAMSGLGTILQNYLLMKQASNSSSTGTEDVLG